MRFPTLLRFVQLLERYSQGAFPIGYYYPQPPTAAAPPCSRQRSLRNLRETGPKGAEVAGIKNKWINVR
jgi:hypothetical protein